MAENLKIPGFSEFYIPIKAHFNENSQDFNDLNVLSSVKEKLLYLLQHDVIVNMCKSKFSITRDGKNVRRTRDDGEKETKQYPQMTKKAKVVVSQSVGRKLIATETIEPGELIIRETPYTTLLYSQFRKSHCEFCFKRLNSEREIISCNVCKYSYCDKSCFERSEHDSWYGSCLISCLPQDAELSQTSLLALRIVLKAGLETIASTVKVDKPIYDSKDYSSVFCQITHEENRSCGDNFRRLMTAIYFAMVLYSLNFFPEASEIVTESLTRNQADIVATSIALVRHLQSCSCNAYEISELVNNDKERVSNELGGAVYPTVSLTNHACDCNTMRYSDGNVCVIRASKTIHKGTEITDNYGEFYQTSNKDSRQKRLKTQYFFDCMCVACKNDWPQISSLVKMTDKYACKGCGSLLLDLDKAQKCRKCKKPLNDVKRMAQKIRSLIESRKQMIATLEHDSNHNPQDVKAIKGIVSLRKEMELYIRSPSWNSIIVEQLITQYYVVQGNYYN